MFDVVVQKAVATGLPIIYGPSYCAKSH